MKVAIVTHRFVKGDGQSRVNYEIARAALARGDEVTLLATEVDAELGGRAGVSWVRVPCSSLPTQLCRNWVFGHRCARWLRHRRGRFDVLHVNGSVTDADADVNTSHFVHAAWRRSRCWNAPRSPRGCYQSLFTSLNAYWERQAYQRSRVVVAVSQRVRAELVDIAVPADRIRVVLNGVDTEEFHPGPADRKAVGFAEGVPIALFVGDIRTPRKNLDTVLQALLRVPTLQLAVAGSTRHSPYPELAERLGLADRVRFLGFRRDVADLMRAADMFVFPSRYEACSLVLLEAMASGLPVITAATAGGAEIVQPECGLVLADPDDVDRLAEGLQAVTEDRCLRAGMSRAARELALQHSWSHMTDEYLRLYAEGRPA
jgi:glycosyltransferase involved in cell wall biosynthesis